MKKIIILFLVLFTLSSIFLKNVGPNVSSFQCPETPDYGFPLHFLSHCMNMKGETENRFSLSSLMIDIVVIFGISAGIVVGYRKLSPSK